jgi:hypothetical protein
MSRRDCSVSEFKKMGIMITYIYLNSWLLIQYTYLFDWYFLHKAIRKIHTKWAKKLLIILWNSFC